MTDTADPLAAAPAPADIPAPASYRWTPALQRDFLEHLAATGSVRIAAAMVSMSTAAVYQLRQRAEGTAFRLGCAAAVLIARARLADELLDRAIWGFEETSERDLLDHRLYTKRTRRDPRLGLAMLARLDRMVETRAREGEDLLAQIIAGDWPGFLSLFAVEGVEGAAGRDAALACWLAARDNRANPLAALWKDSGIAREVARFSADPAEAPDPAPDPTPEEEAAGMRVWFDDRADEWRTDFPPPAGYAGQEEGLFGDEDYERTLDPDEEDAWDAAREAEVAPLRRAGEAARRAWFGIPDPANDRDGCEEAQGNPAPASKDAIPGESRGPCPEGPETADDRDPGFRQGSRA